MKVVRTTELMPGARNAVDVPWCAPGETRGLIADEARALLPQDRRGAGRRARTYTGLLLEEFGPRPMRLRPRM